MTPAVLATLIRTVGGGLKGNLNYPDFENWEAVLLATEGALVGSMASPSAATSACASAPSAPAAPGPSSHPREGGFCVGGLVPILCGEK